MKLRDTLAPISNLHPASPAPPLRKPAALQDEEGPLRGNGGGAPWFPSYPLQQQRGKPVGSFFSLLVEEQLRDGSIELMAILRM